MAARMFGSLLGDEWAADDLSERIDTRRPVKGEFRSLLFLAGIGVVAAVSTGGLFVAGFALLPQPKATEHSRAASAAAAKPMPAQAAAAGAVSAPSPAVLRTASTAPASGSPRVPATPTPAGVAAKAPSRFSASGSPGGAVAPAPAANQAQAAARFALAQGNANFADGEVAVARFYYERAVDAGAAEAAVRIGETFDPIFLTEGRLRSVSADPEAARYWYLRARALGAAEATERLEYLDAEPATAHSTSERRSWQRRAAAGGATLTPPSTTFHRLLERILHPFPGG
jgi:hypothetical protein